MLVTAHIAEARTARWQKTSTTWGLVPTMGYLHAGHLSLVERARQENEHTAVTIYVNPTQFAPGEDLARYPRNLERDLALLADAGVDLVFTPTDETMYPPGFQTAVSISRLSQQLEGASRPTHFEGVATIVAKLFNILMPTRAYFGQKDAQQTAVLRRMVTDLNFDLTLHVCPTIREHDGLALSSRNAYLTPAERAAAPVLYRALSRARQAVQAGMTDANLMREDLRAHVREEPLAQLDYVSVADWNELAELQLITGTTLISLAARFGHTRLIDNILVDPVPGRVTSP